MDYRYATSAEDIALLASWNQQLIADEGSSNRMDVPELENRMKEWLRDGGYSAILFSRGAFVVAYALFRESADRSIFLRQFFVARDRRQRGIGKAAMTVLFEEVWPGKKVYVECLVGNPGGLAFWRSLGFADHTITMERDASQPADTGD